MNRLESELQRLYQRPAAGQPADAPPGPVRALVLELAGPADWRLLSQVWRGVQADLGLPAPAIAVSGSDGLQLWFSLQTAVSAARGADFLARLAARYLPEVAPCRLRLQPSGAAAPAPVPLIPAPAAAAGQWSAFVAPDLAPIFADTPWLDVEPGLDGQADLLARLQSMDAAAFEAAMSRLPPGVQAAAVQAPAPASQAPQVDARAFLQRVLDDETVDLALRVEAAKALLGTQIFRPA